MHYNRTKKYKFTLENDHCFYVPELEDVVFSAPFFRCFNGHCVISKGYSWNGATLAKDYPETYIATLEHDVLYQYGAAMNLKRKIADLVFRQKMTEANFKYTNYYYIAVRLCGWFFYYLLN